MNFRVLQSAMASELLKHGKLNGKAVRDRIYTPHDYEKSIWKWICGKLLKQVALVTENLYNMFRLPFLGFGRAKKDLIGKT